VVLEGALGDRVRPAIAENGIKINLNKNSQKSKIL
jgi:hypothetical protein